MSVYVVLDLQGATPVRVATSRGDLAMVKLLLSHGASVGPEANPVSTRPSL